MVRVSICNQWIITIDIVVVGPSHVVVINLFLVPSAAFLSVPSMYTVHSSSFVISPACYLILSVIQCLKKIFIPRLLYTFTSCLKRYFLNWMFACKTRKCRYTWEILFIKIVQIVIGSKMFVITQLCTCCNHGTILIWSHLIQSFEI